jgi:UDP-2,4-diacetamido-2,4,6-trideoxy-beta-L-altropyranose hydrolase
MSKMKQNQTFEIYIKVNGDSKIGMGHVYRTLNLAMPLKQKHIKIIFLTKNKIVQQMVKKKFDCKLLSNNIKKEKNTISKINSDVVILDEKDENPEILKILKKSFSKIYAIDYVGKNKNLIDVGINMLYPKSGVTKYSFSGLNYAILNKNFTQKRKIKKTVSSILILQGGADTHCLIPQVIKSLNLVNHEFSITVVVGPSFSCWNELEIAKNDSQKPLKIIHNVKNMSSVMLKHDLAITAGGMTLLELSRCGIPSIVTCGEKLEEETALLMQKHGFGINLGFNKKINSKQLAESTSNMILNYKLRQKMNKVGPKLVDGRGAFRVAKLIRTELN